MMGVDTDDHLYLRGALTNDRGIDFRALQQINATPLFPASYNFFLIFALCLLPSAFCFTALYRDCIDRLRKQSRFKLVTGAELLEIHDPAKADVDFENRDLIRQIREAMDHLPDRQRVILELRDFQDFDYEEIAKMMNMTVNAVRVTVARSRASISAQMKKEISYGTGTL
jgi:predicted RNA polymerase sigma factor